MSAQKVYTAFEGFGLKQNPSPNFQRPMRNYVHPPLIHSDTRAPPSSEHPIAGGSIHVVWERPLAPNPPLLKSLNSHTPPFTAAFHQPASLAFRSRFLLRLSPSSRSFSAQSSRQAKPDTPAAGATNSRPSGRRTVSLGGAVVLSPWRRREHSRSFKPRDT